ncbi:MAG: CDC27 family protein [Pirellulaceae bacterium]|nr:CDC27 family protein [Pirellulaceae bacterium]
MKHSIKQTCLFWILAIVVVGSGVSCKKRTRDMSEQIVRQLDQKTLKTDSLRQGMRNLAQMTPANRKNLTEEVRVLLNTWVKAAHSDGEGLTESKLISGWDPAAMRQVGSESFSRLQFATADIDYLFQCRLMRQLSNWIIAEPVRDTLLEPALNSKQQTLDTGEAVKLEHAYKLFDWTIRNIKLAGVPSSQAQIKTPDPREPLTDGGVGYSLLPLEATLYGAADFIVRGRVFAALAAQQGLTTCWISVGAQPGHSGDLLAMGVLIGKQLLLFEPKLGLPILDPDDSTWASLPDLANNPRILRRMSLPQYQYAFDAQAIRAVQLLLDAVPFATSLRAKLLDQGLLGDERMTVYADLDAMANELAKAVPNSTTAVWQTPLLAQLFAAQMQERLRETTDFSMRYMAEHGVWLMDNSLANGRWSHLAGRFEKSMDHPGALKLYIETRIDEQTLGKLAYDPDVQKSLGLFRGNAESKEQFEARVLQAHSIFSRAKFDVAYMLAQAHYDRGDFQSCAGWLKDRVLADPRAMRWHAPAWYLLARAYTQLNRLEDAAHALTQPAVDLAGGGTSETINPQDAGNRLRLRYLRRQQMEAAASTQPDSQPSDTHTPPSNALDDGSTDPAIPAADAGGDSP